MAESDFLVSQPSPKKRKGAAVQSIAAFAGVALVDGRTSAAVGDVSPSWWSEKVRDGIAPKPVIRLPRYTRWKATEVADFWRKFVEDARDDARSDQVTRQAKTASDAARSKRLLKATGSQA